MTVSPFYVVLINSYYRTRKLLLQKHNMKLAMVFTNSIQLCDVLNNAIDLVYKILYCCN